MNYFSRVSISFLLFVLPFTAFSENASFTTSHFSGSDNCATCHDGLTDTSGENVSIVRDWGASMMANSAKDPFWQAKVATELERNPQLSTVINDTCTKCHAPMANYEITQVQGGDITLFGPNGILDTNHALYDAGMNGVSCTVCHQITDDAALGTLAGFSGQYNINDTKTIYGQYSNIFGQPMVNNTGYTPAYSAHVSDSAMCASCHNLKTPFVDNGGNVVSTSPESEFPEQMPYTEWQNSIFDDAGSNPQSCQDCHMPETTSKVSNRPRWLGTKNGFAKHELVGANTTMLTMLRDNAAQLDVTSTNMDLSIDRARAMLQSAATVEIVSASISNGVLEARVKVQNNSGHKAPTAYPSRRMWLHFKVTDSSNKVVFESGRINADGSITGADNDTNQAMFEPHYELITAADQVQIYETVMGDSDGNITYTLLRGSHYKKDNRLTPQGFDKYAVPADVAVRGVAFDDTDFNQGSDEITYRVPVAAAGDIDINVSLNYQTIAHGFLQDLYSEGHLEQVQTFKTLYDAQSLKHEQVASAQATVVGDGGSTPPPAPVVDLWSTPVTIDAGQSATLSWSATDANGCSATWTASTATNGSATVSPSATTTYNMTCDGDGGSDTNSVTVTVNQPVPAPVVSLTADNPVIDQGQSTILRWNATDATSCTADWTTSTATNGSATVAPSATTTYSMTCNGNGGSDTNSVNVTVNLPPAPAPVTSLTADTPVIDQGQSTILRWSATDATSCTAGWTASTATSGSATVTPGATTTYSMTCNGDGGSDTNSVTVTVNTPPVVDAPTVNLTASPASVSRGSTITLSWSSTDANSCTASGSWAGAKPISGSQSLTINGPVTFTLTCNGDGGTATGSASYTARGRRWLNLQ